MILSLAGPSLGPQVRTWQGDGVHLAVVDLATGESGPGLEAGLPRHLSGRVMAADIRLHQRLDLARDLKAEARDLARPGRIDDESLALAALARWGDAAPERLLGDFAFASWDVRERRLFCARDAAGVRPFFYLHRPGRLFAFASLPKALCGPGLAVGELNAAFFLLKFLSSQEDESESLCREIHRLPAGHALTVSADSFQVRRYWTLPEVRPTGRSLRPADVAAELGDRIAEAVRCRLPASGPVATHLSGGLDSSALTVLAHRKLREQGRETLAYSFLADRDVGQAWRDESPFVRAVLDAEPGIQWQPIYREPLAQTLAPPTGIGQVFSSDPQHPEHQVCLQARARGASVLLSGWGGDQGASFGGRGSLAEAAAGGHWLRVAWETAALSLLSRTLPHRVMYGEVIAYLRWRDGDDEAAALAPRARRGRLWPLLAPAARQPLKFKALSVGPDAWLNRWTLLGGSHVAARMENWALIGASHGVAFSFPLLDRRVVEYALSIPSELFVRNGWKRRPFRDAMQQVLPAPVLWRRHKFTPFPCLALDLAEQRPRVLQRVAELRRSDAVNQLFDLEALERSVQAMPEPGTIRRLEALHGARGLQLTNPHVILVRAFLYASYLESHPTLGAA